MRTYCILCAPQTWQKETVDEKLKTHNTPKGKTKEKKYCTKIELTPDVKQELDLKHINMCAQTNVHN